jgi:hypothetical protein
MGGKYFWRQQVGLQQHERDWSTTLHVVTSRAQYSHGTLPASCGMTCCTVVGIKKDMVVNDV